MIEERYGGPKKKLIEQPWAVPCAYYLVAVALVPADPVGCLGVIKVIICPHKYLVWG